MTLRRIEINVSTGVTEVIDLTPDEESSALKRAAVENAKPVVIQETVADLKAALIAKGILTDQDITSAAVGIEIA